MELVPWTLLLTLSLFVIIPLMVIESWLTIPIISVIVIILVPLNTWPLTVLFISVFATTIAICFSHSASNILTIVVPSRIEPTLIFLISAIIALVYSLCRVIV